MIDYEKAAEKLMAATELHIPGEIGMDWLEWKDIYGSRPGTIEIRKVIEEQLRGFARQVIEDANETMALAQHEQIMKDLEGMRKKP